MPKQFKPTDINFANLDIPIFSVFEHKSFKKLSQTQLTILHIHILVPRLI